MAQNGLGGCPDELIIEIIKSIDSPRSLSALSGCSRRYHTLTEPVLYSSYREPGGDTMFLPLFLRTILLRPDLTRHATRFISSSTFHRKADMRVMDLDDLQRLEESISHTYCASTLFLDWVEAAKNGEWETLTAVLLCLLPNIEYVDCRNHCGTLTKMLCLHLLLDTLT